MTYTLGLHDMSKCLPKYTTAQLGKIAKCQTSDAYNINII